MSGFEHRRKALLPPTVSDFLTALGAAQRPRGPERRPPLWRLAALWVFGALALALITLVCSALDAGLTTTAFAFLIAIVLLSLLDSFVSSAIFSLIAVSCLNFFFVQPLYTFVIGDVQDVVTLAAFLVTSLAVTSLIRRVRTLSDAQREQARLLDLAADAIFVRDRHDVITYWNRGAEQLYGWTREEALGKVTHRLLQTVFPVPLPEIEAALSQTGHWEGELLHTTRAGAKLSVASRWSRPLDEGGLAIGTLESNTDITERKRAEEALQRSQAAYLAEAQKLSHTGSFGWNASDGDIFWSEESYRIFGYDPATKPTLERVLERTHPDDVALVRSVCERAARDRQGFELEHRLLMPDGAVKHLHVVAHVMVDEPGQLQFVGALMDVTERRRTEAALRASEHRYHNLFQAMAASFWELDFSGVDTMLQELRGRGVADVGAYLAQNPAFVRAMMRATRVVDVNDQTVALFGRGSKAELLGTVEPFWPEESAHVYAQSVLARAGHAPSFSVECRLRRIDGSRFDALFTAAFPPETAGKGTLVIGVIDITERVRAQEMLERVQADFAHAARVSMLGELTASIAHEVNQPLAAIAANGEAGLRWLGRPEPDLAELRDLTASVVADARRAADIIGRIRTMAARQAPEKALLSLDEVIREALVFLRHEVQARGVTIAHHVAPAAPQVLADRTLLQQVIVNLAVNAMHAMVQAGSKQRRITIRTAVPGPATLRCTVEDSGPGIGPENLARLFESFFTTKQGGLGMGLPICRSIIEAHGGSIIADDGSADGGARFRFTLPAGDKLDAFIAGGQEALHDMRERRTIDASATEAANTPPEAS